MIVALQAFLIIILFWMLIFYGKDEYEAFQVENEEEIESLSRVNEKDGINIVTLTPATQKNSGIHTTKLTNTSFSGEIKSYGNVIGIDGLIEAKTQLTNIHAEINLIKANQPQNQAQYQRLKNLNSEDKIVSDRAVQEALMTINSEQAKLQALQIQLKQLKESTELKWGELLSSLVFSQQPSATLKGLLNRKMVLLQIGLPNNITPNQSGASIQVTPLNSNDQKIIAHYISPATQSDLSGYGKTFYYVAPSDSLRIGMRVKIKADPNIDDAKKGIIIPNAAVVWHAGTAWAYFKQNNNQFVRKPISTDTEVEDGWFNQNIDTNNEIVISGAQLLLSEEFKYLIKNENED